MKIMGCFYQEYQTFYEIWKRQRKNSEEREADRGEESNELANYCF